VLTGPVLTGAVLAGAVLAGAVLAGAVLAGPVSAGTVLADIREEVWRGPAGAGGWVMMADILVTPILVCDRKATIVRL